MTDFVFTPTDQQIQNSNIYKFMKKYDVSNLQQLSIKANENLEWFWQEVENYFGIIWDTPYTKVLDTSKGIPWSKWYVDGKTNIYKSSVEKFAKKNPDKTAYVFVSEDDKVSKITYSELDIKSQQTCKCPQIIRCL
ncbi:acetyl-coenzyme A synthetase N-terminal domain-containing protein [Candidatus Nitrosarchaeum limnium]|uniref:Acetyl-coenzyme A synthetase N-terminal domain-containing protein n=1 Tax=Candidatus Nitrosarchaeum limnium BG20 TaxID=859192 RepID=S2E5X4_9ARCH|nr:acetyl-coenzyme A synthetase N-terminal domain-containing protein [Candidatus Nitrosarchaeum limnium]EPA06550.1 hypothetical protein BG20_I1153 [Candidatus Nitrosarchaeum limnium BG20]